MEAKKLSNFESMKKPCELLYQIDSIMMEIKKNIIDLVMSCGEKVEGKEYYKLDISNTLCTITDGYGQRKIVECVIVLPSYNINNGIGHVILQTNTNKMLSFETLLYQEIYVYNAVYSVATKLK